MNKSNLTRYTTGIAIGLGLGLIIEIIFDKVGLGIAIGLPIGVALGFTLTKKSYVNTKPTEQLRDAGIIANSIINYN